MGCSGSKTEADIHNERIEMGLKEDRKKMSRDIKLLLLGTGESGKSTIAKQLRILHTDGFTEAELQAYKPVITNNVLTAFKNIMNASEGFGQLHLLYTDPNLKEAVEFFRRVEPLTDELSPRVAAYVKALWPNPVVQDTLNRYSLFQLPDCTFYLTENIERICRKNYIPTQEDMLRCRARTTGIMELEFTIESFKFRIVDVGGQRSERKKWIHVFEGVTAIIFLCSLK